MALPLRRLLENGEGAAAVEFAVIAPVLLTILLGILTFGDALKNHLVLTNAASAGALTLALSRGTSTPYTTATTAVVNTAPTLDKAKIGVTVAIGNAACASDPACSTALTVGSTAVVTATYPCELTVMGINYEPGNCVLTATSAQMVQ
jgi:Flp pilus assembly protein TadG